jgi:FtsP/CotA-like multicopper oxidase with cupredoxin domain
MTYTRTAGFETVTTGNDTTYYSELPDEGSTEVWEIVNITADAHPIHLHLVQFQIINRENFDVGNYIAVYNQSFPGGGFDPATGLPYPANVFMPSYGPPSSIDQGANPLSGGKYGGNPDIAGTFPKNKNQFPYLKGRPAPPLPAEAGWKDTVVAYPGQVTRLAVRWAPTDLLTTAVPADLYFPFDPNGYYAHGYVWHCHIIDHEDNEMMRPFSVALNDQGAPVPALRPLVKGADY